MSNLLVDTKLPELTKNVAETIKTLRTDYTLSFDEAVVLLALAANLENPGRTLVAYPPIIGR